MHEVYNPSEQFVEYTDKQEAQTTVIPDPYKYNRKYKDGVFKLLFKEPEHAAGLYRALTFAKCDPKDIQILTLEEAISKNFVNDLAFVVDGRTLVVSEHQSVINHNMPLRMAIYLGRLMETYLGLDRENSLLHRGALLTIPTPEFVVLYNGEKQLREDETLLKLTNAFRDRPKRGMGTVELSVPVYDINQGRNVGLLQRSRSLYQYAEFVDTTRRYLREDETNPGRAFKSAVDDCIARGILTDFLRRYGGDIVSILEEDFTMGRYGDAREKDGVTKGEKNKALDIARKMLRRNRPLEEIIEDTGLTRREVESLKVSDTTIM